MSDEKLGSEGLILFTAVWDEELGPEIVDFYPSKSNVGDLEKLAEQIFTVRQFFLSSPDIEKSKITLPINRISKKAKVIFDKTPNMEIKGKFKPFILVLLLSDYFLDEQLDAYDEIMEKINHECFKNVEVSLKEYYQELTNVFALSQIQEDPDLKISEYYSYTAAVEDFQAGVKLFKTKNFDQAYQPLKKALLKFEQENNKHLIMEVLFICGSLFAQQKKFQVAEGYFKQLEELAEELQHQKYSELSTFMQGFCSYKNENYISAQKKFDKLNISKTKFLNKLQYFTIYGRILANLEKFEGSLQNLLRALVISTNMKTSDLVIRQQSQILYDLGVINNRIAVEKLKGLGINKKEDYQTYLQEAINYFERALELLVELNDSDKIIQIYLLIGNIFEFLEKELESLGYYEKALDVSIKSNNPSKRIKILNRVVQKQIKLKKYEESISELNDVLSNIDEYKFVDLYTIASFHRQLANCLNAIGKKTEGLLELLNTYEILKTFKTPVYEELDVLNQIVEIYTEMNDSEKISHFKEEINNVSDKIKSIAIQKPKAFRPLGEVKEIWVFHSKIGVEIYNYALESKIDNDLLGGFLTAIQNFSYEISQKKLNDMVMGNDRYMIYQEDYDFYILGRADAKISIEIIKNILSKIYRRFWKEYSKYIKTFQGNIKYFKNFTQIIESLDLTLM